MPWFLQLLGVPVFWELLGSLRILEMSVISSPGRTREDGVPVLTLAWLCQILLGTSPLPLTPIPASPG